MSEQILEQYGRVTICTEANHPSPIYHVDGDIQPNPYGIWQHSLKTMHLKK